MRKRFRELVDGVFALEEDHHTTGLIRTRAGAMVIDPSDDPDAAHALDVLLGELGLEVRMVVSTSGGSGRAPGANRFPDALLLYPSPGGAPRHDGPAVSFTRDAYLRLGITSVELLHVGSPATDLLLVNLPTRGAAFLGAALPGERLDEVDRRALVERVGGLDPVIVVPGRGRAVSARDLRLLERRVRDEVGQPPLALVADSSGRRALAGKG